MPVIFVYLLVWRPSRTASTVLDITNKTLLKVLEKFYFNNLI